MLRAAQSAASAEILERNTEAAVAADAVGAPVYVLNGEPFWGQDRLDYLAHALETGRAPFRS
jgi:2-hydroxychromene-2-carboxylate isomerase